MNELKNFSFEGRQIRALTIEGEPYFVGKDVAEVLGYSNSRKAIADHVDSEDKGVTKCYTLGGTQQTTIINESGLYSLILSSKLPDAKKFKHWVTSEVLPAIRKHGAYMTDAKAASIVTDKGSLADLLQQAAEQLKRKDIQIEQMKPKALFADAVSTSDTPILVGELAKILHQNGVSMGQNRMFRWLRDNGYLISKKGTSYNMPTQRAMELGLFKIKENAITHSDGHVTITKTPKVTGKGQVYFVNKFVGEEGLACRI
ncbi:phage antirepressor [Ligilactobacillus ruminis]|uniref:Toxin-antitoxin system, toxin component, Bro family n=2 Tax=Ligilactobacillus ruminis TaxID=1623 RepID=A0A837IUF8_9LACO|nr:phage antirepressor KilAC domain-containing protein [Ligilactobacillus ruminis]KLA46989.1 toxin-antitoxin system, toxin component, Bro family [Ligilactobacillus ruminis]KRM82827.1 toxin-antitoxin system, toxin component, Bro family [Ligilactobacillus ruminis DSM 20403 = NBRC 102161]SFG41520.1 anti-repressor protein [Ligilactobacillus ruminis DSM 20403 = NBRC 102161]